MYGKLGLARSPAPPLERRIIGPGRVHLSIISAAPAACFSNQCCGSDGRVPSATSRELSSFPKAGPERRNHPLACLVSGHCAGSSQITRTGASPCARRRVADPSTRTRRACLPVFDPRRRSRYPVCCQRRRLSAIFVCQERKDVLEGKPRLVEAGRNHHSLTPEASPAGRPGPRTPARRKGSSSRPHAPH